MAKAKPERRLRLHVKVSTAHFIYPLITKNFYGSFHLFSNTKQSAGKHRITFTFTKRTRTRVTDGALRTTPCVWRLPYHQGTRTQDSSFGLWGFLLPIGTPLLLIKFSQCPQHPSWSRGGRRIHVSFFPPPVTLYILLDQGYRRHYAKSSNNCTKNETNSDPQNKKQKPTTKPLGTLHCLCRWP